MDIVSVSAFEHDTADDALEELERTLAANGNYKDRIKRSKPCIRLEYADDEIGKFHVDVVPARESSGEAPYDAPRRGEGWHPTAPREFTSWCASQGSEFLITVKALKHWRSVQQDRAAIKSIVLQALIVLHMPKGTYSDAERVTLTLEAMHHALSGMSSAPRILNPVLPSENLTRRWSDSDFRDFYRPSSRCFVHCTSCAQ